MSGRAQRGVGIALSLVLAALSPAARAQQPAGSATDTPPLPDPAADSYRQHMNVGISFYEQKNYVAAIAEFEEAYKAKPKASPLVNMALCYKAMFAYPKAIRALETAIEKHSDTMDENDKKAANTEIQEMRALLAYVTFKVTPGQFAVQIDGETYPEASQGKTVLLSPGPHNIRVFGEGYAAIEQKVTLVSGQRILEYTLTPNMGFVKIKAASQRFAIAVDQKALDYGQWTGLLAPGPHVIEMYVPGSTTPPYRVRLDVEIGKSYEISPGKGGVPMFGSAVVSPQPIPVPPKPPAPPIKGPFALATVSMFFPTEQPAAFAGQDLSPGVSAGARLGYRINTPVSFDAMFEYSNMLVVKRDEDINFNLEQIHAGINMRLQTPGKTARFYGNFGGGFVWESLDFTYPKSDNGHSRCLDSNAKNITPRCNDVEGFDGYFLIEGGLQFTFGGVLVDLGVGTYLQSTRGFGPGTYKDWLPIFEAGLRVGYGLW